MGYSVDITRASDGDSWVVSVRAHLTREEANDLFLSGDSIVSWPAEGLVPDALEGSKPERTGMFVSEIAARPMGLRLLYRESTQAHKTAALLQKQLSNIGIATEAQPEVSDRVVSVDPLKDALTEYLTIPGMKAALLVSDQGLLISCVADDGVDSASIAALAVDTVSAVQRFGIQVQAGYLDTMRIEFDKLTVVLAPFAPDVMLTLVATAGSLGAMSRDLAQSGVPAQVTPGPVSVAVHAEPPPTPSEGG